MNFGLNLWNKVLGRMFGFFVMLIMTLSEHPWIINMIVISIVRYNNLIEKKYQKIFSSFSANFWSQAEWKRSRAEPIRAENPSAQAMAQASSAQTHHYCLTINDE